MVVRPDQVRSLSFPNEFYFVFDNPDFNVCILIGNDRFNRIGDIACITPPGSVNECSISISKYF